MNKKNVALLAACGLFVSFSLNVIAQESSVKLYDVQADSPKAERSQTIQTAQSVEEKDYASFGQAIENNDIAKIESIIAKGVDLKREIGWGFKPLTRAARYHAYEAASLLIKAGAEINAIDNFEGLSPLGYAAKYNDIIMADLLLKAKAAVSLKGENGYTPLHYAVENGNVDMTKILLASGADSSIKNAAGKSPVEIAAAKGNTELLTVFHSPITIKKQEIQASVKKAVKIKQRSSAGFIYGIVRSDIKAAEVLVPLGKDINKKDSEGYTVLMVAAAQNDMSAVELLIKSGADVNAKNNEGESALLFAANRNSSAMVKLLLSHGADANIKTKKGLTPLMCAASKDYLEVLKTLLSNGAKINELDYQKKNALFYAANSENTSSVRLLLENGADAASKDVFGNTPASWAQKRGFARLAAMMN